MLQHNRSALILHVKKNHPWSCVILSNKKRFNFLLQKLMEPLVKRMSEGQTTDNLEPILNAQQLLSSNDRHCCFHTKYECAEWDELLNLILKSR
jgi:hypothetical protein